MSRSILAQSLARPGGAIVLAALAPVLACATATASVATQRPGAATGRVSHVRGTSAFLEGSVNPRGLDTSYYFQYGATTAYGAQTPTVAVGKGTKPVKVGQAVANLPVGSHYRIVAMNSAGPTLGHDRTFAATKKALKFTMASTRKLPPTPYGGTFVLRGTLSGSGGALHQVTLQSSPFPFLSAFVDLGAPITTNAAGAFAIPVRGLTRSTQLRLKTNDPRPLLGPTVTAHVAPRVTLKVHASSQRGLVRLYGTVTPAEVGARVLLQLERAVRPRAKSENETETRFATQDSTVVKRGTRSVSRFSKIFTVRRGGRYRAYVVLRSGALVSGASPSITLHSARGGATKGK